MRKQARSLRLAEDHVNCCWRPRAFALSCPLLFSSLSLVPSLSLVGRSRGASVRGCSVSSCYTPHERPLGLHGMIRRTHKGDWDVKARRPGA